MPIGMVVESGFGSCLASRIIAPATQKAPVPGAFWVAGATGLVSLRRFAGQLRKPKVLRSPTVLETAVSLPRGANGIQTLSSGANAPRESDQIPIGAVTGNEGKVQNLHIPAWPEGRRDVDWTIIQTPGVDHALRRWGHNSGVKGRVEHSSNRNFDPEGIPWPWTFSTRSPTELERATVSLETGGRFKSIVGRFVVHPPRLVGLQYRQILSLGTIAVPCFNVAWPSSTNSFSFDEPSYRFRARRKLWSLPGRL
jgi:hypothetical protein